MTLYRESEAAFSRYGSLPSAVDRTALDEIALYGDLLQAVADWVARQEARADGAEGADSGDGAEGPANGAAARLDQQLIDRALGLLPAAG